MIGRVVEIAEDGRHLARDRGFLVVTESGDEIGRVPMDDIAVVLCNAHGLTYSNNLLLALTERGVAIVLCAPNHQPAAWVWPLAGHHAQAERMRYQVEATRPMGKRLWQLLVRAKIAQQAAVLDILCRNADPLRDLARRVRSGDPQNVEAQAARRYWPLVMGSDFRRDRGQPGVNSLLNYGYTVLRAGVARAVTAAGLHPSIGIHHRTRTDPMCLASDLMEPFRPLVDLVVCRLRDAGLEEVDPESKARLARLLTLDMATARGTTPVLTCLERLAQSVARSYEQRTAQLDLPDGPLPLDLGRVG